MQAGPSKSSPNGSPEMYLSQDAVVMDIPGSKFGFAYPSEQGSHVSLSSEQTLDSESDEQDSGSDLSNSPMDLRESDDNYSGSTSIKSLNPQQPKFSRALSMPEPSQLGHLQNPHRAPTLSAPAMTSTEPLAVDPFRELSIDLADSVQMVIQTMLQISPLQILDPAKEQFSACSLAVPTPSMSAILTAMKSLNYISANMSAFCEPNSTIPIGLTTPPGLATNAPNDFDIAELLQSVGDALSGAAANAGVDLVLFHADTGMKHVMVNGDENGVAYALSHIIRQVLSSAEPGDAIEVGLFIQSSDNQSYASSSSSPSTPLICVFDVSHKFGDSELRRETDSLSNEISRPTPDLSTLLLRRLLAQIGGTLNRNLTPKTFPIGRSCELKLELEVGSVSELDLLAIPEGDAVATSMEPTLFELEEFTETLKGKKVTLCANSNGSFAHHLTSYLMAWGMDIIHLPSEGKTEGFEEGFLPPLPHEEQRHSGAPQPLSFIFIDDDVAVLKQRLQALRVTAPYQLNLNLRKRPSLSTNHRPRSSVRISTTRSGGQLAIPTVSSAVIIVHFTSLGNFKIAKDAIQTIVASYAGSQVPIPEVMILPKPAGPRRILTALHTAVTKPVVDPFFTPTATAPASPNVQSAPFFNSYSRSPMSLRRPSGSRSNSDRSTKDFMEAASSSSTHQPPLPSPLGMSDNVEYFADAAATVKLGTSPSSGLVIQSPDGQPAGIYFHPRSKGSKSSTPSSQNMERGNGQLFLPPGTTSRRTSDTDMKVGNPTFSSLHTASASALKPKGSPEINTTQKGKPSPRIDEAVNNANYPTTFQQATSISRKSSPSDLRKMGSPPGSPRTDSTTQRRPNRRLTETLNNGTPPIGKGKGSDANIVPPINVLVVDDNAINQKVVCAYMKKIKIKYDTASNGLEAVEKWKTGGFHLILMDIQMPIMDGIQATKEIRRLEKVNANAGFPPATPSSEGTRTPDSTSEPRPSPYRSSVIIVALTASSLQSDRVAALAAGCNDFLTKPVSHQWLNSKIVEWGSIKALQMYANIRSIDTTAQTKAVAERLHVPPAKAARSSTPSPVGEPSTSNEQPSVPFRLISSSGLSTQVPVSSSSSAFWSPGQPSPSNFWGGATVASPTSTTNNKTPPPTSETRDDREEPPPEDIYSSSAPSFPKPTEDDMACVSTPPDAQTPAAENLVNASPNPGNDN